MQSNSDGSGSGESARSASAREEHAQACAYPQPTNRGYANSKILRRGIDSLYVSLPGALSRDWAERLEQAKRYAQSDDEAKQALACLSIVDHQFSVGAAGAKLFPYVLNDGCYRIQLCSLKSKRLPLAYAQIRSAFLTAVGHVQALSQLRQIVGGLGDVSGPFTVSRLDLFVDFAIPDFDPGLLSRNAWVSRSREVSAYWDGEKGSGWTVGSGGVLSARLYDKTLQIRKSGQDYLKPLWKEAGWDGECPVFRLEFQIRGDVLRGFGYSDASEVFAALGSLWRYASEDWLRLVIPNPDDKTRSRWPLHPVWQALQVVEWGQDVQPLKRMTKPQTAPALERVHRNYFACLSSYMAREGISDALDAAIRLHEAAKDYFNEALLMFGRSFDEAARDRAARKATQWNLPFAGVQERLEAEELEKQARLYRQQSGR